METLRIKGLIGQPVGFDEMLSDYFDESKLQTYLDEHSGSAPIKIQINSGGGYTDVGLAMYDLLRTSEKDVEVDVLKICGSIATVLLLAGKKGKRRAHKNSEIFIHNPYWMPAAPIPVNREEVKKIDKDLAVIEDRIMSIYLANTNADRETLETLMKAETSLTPEKALELGFIDEIIQHDIKDEKRYPVMAFINNQNTNKMDFTPSQKTYIERLFDGFTKKFNKYMSPVFMMFIDLDNGTKIFIESESNEDLIGKKAFSVNPQGERTNDPVQDGNYTTKDNRIITVAQGLVSNVVKKEDENSEVSALKKQVSELTAQLETKTKEGATATAEVVALKGQFTTIKNEFEAFKGQILAIDTPGTDQSFKGDQPVMKSENQKWLELKRAKQAEKELKEKVKP